MCGLFGIAGNGIVSRHLEALHDLLWVSALRGRDSTGVFAAKTYREKDSSTLIKQDTDSAQFLFDHGHRRGLLCDFTYDLFMGHTRWATVGKVTRANAHPFDVGNLVGAHNGTLVSKEFLSPAKTDSQMMFEKMGRVGVKETLDGLSYGDHYAISVYDKSTRNLILARNHGRPLYYAICKKADVIMWASEAYMLHLAAARNNLVVKVFEVTPHTIFKFDIGKIEADNLKPYTQEVVKHDDPWQNLNEVFPF